MKKWRNKITGEINEFMVHKRIEDSEDGNPVYAPFDGNIDEWEDAPEPKGYWYIEGDGDIHHIGTELCDELEIHTMKQIGNYFDSREEAEKAVRKLKAWKRLKDKGFDFVGCFKDNTINYEFVERPLDYDEVEEVEQDLAFLFGGEE